MPRRRLNPEIARAKLINNLEAMKDQADLLDQMQADLADHPEMAAFVAGLRKDVATSYNLVAGTLSSPIGDYDV